MYENSLVTIEINENKSRSVSPLTTVRYRDFISDLSRRFVGRRSHDGVIYNSAGDDSEGSSESSTSFHHNHHYHEDQCKSNLELFSDSSENSSSSGTDDSDKSEYLSKRLYRRSLSVVRMALSELSISTRATSRHSTPAKKSISSSSGSTSSSSSSSKKDKKVQPKILRQPISYTYLKGMSGLPTQRVPRSSVCCQYTCRRQFIV